MKKIIIAVLLLVVVFMFSSETYAFYYPDEDVSFETDDNRWIITGDPLINVDEEYSFNTSYNGVNYNILNPNYNPYYAKYVNNNDVHYTNETNFFVYATDSTNQTVLLEPASSLMYWGSLQAEGTVSIDIDDMGLFPSNVALNNDSRCINNTQSYFHLSLPNNANPQIGYGIVLYRYFDSLDGVTSNNYWYDYIMLDSFRLYDPSDSLRINIPAGKYAQICLLYEVHNWDNSFFQQHWYYHVCAIYNIHTNVV